LKQAGDKKRSLQRAIGEKESQQQRLVQDYRDSTGLMARLQEYERNEADWKALRLELQKLPADAEAQVRDLRQWCDVLGRTADAVRILERFAHTREELRKAMRLQEAAAVAQQQVSAKGEKLRADFEARKQRLGEAEVAAKGARDRANELTVLVRQAEQGLAELAELEGEKVCRHCGQDLTPDHVEEEARRRGARVAELQAKGSVAAQASQVAEATEQEARKQFHQAQHELQEARVEYSTYKKDLEQAQRDVTRLRGECGHVVAELPDEFRGRVGPRPEEGWTATTYPAVADLAALRTEAGRAAEVGKQLEKAESAHRKWTDLRAREATFQQALERLAADLPADHAELRKRHSSLQAAEVSLERSLAADRLALRETEREEERLRKERDASKEVLGRLHGQVKEQEVVRLHADQAVAKALKHLPTNWHAAAQTAGFGDLSRWAGERSDLETAQTEERVRQLQQARAGLDGLRREVEDLERQEDHYPAEARQDAAALQTNLTTARQAESACDKALTEAEKQRALLETYRNQREEIEEECLQTDADLSTQRLLAELLGRERLQLYLVRQAERQVVDYANAVLDRLSGGQLYLKLSGEANGEGSSAKALELEAYNRGTGERPINVAFLSGSQKFRVAVSLALGIGQYASRQHRPIESVIIDEGFGCLDSQGRQVMIQELQNLRGQMRCILLVSHQEEFAEAFADGYHFQLESGATKVTRFHR
jgi:DNA repair exonuclease SbcCD ATPase subunit